jgi:hypothetical protein
LKENVDKNNLESVPEGIDCLWMFYPFFGVDHLITCIIWYSAAYQSVVFVKVSSQVALLSINSLSFSGGRFLCFTHDFLVHVQLFFHLYI